MRALIESNATTRCWLSGGPSCAELWQILDYIRDRHLAGSEFYQAIEVATSATPYHILTFIDSAVCARTREIVVHPNYLVVYRVTDRIEIVTVLHARQEYP